MQDKLYFEGTATELLQKLNTVRASEQFSNLYPVLLLFQELYLKYLFPPPPCSDMHEHYMHFILFKTEKIISQSE